MRDSADYRELIDWAPTPFLEIDPAGKVCAANAAACELLGYTSSELRTQDLLAIVEASQTEFRRLFHEIIAGAKTPGFVKLTFSHRQGTPVFTETHWKARQKANGTLQSIWLALIDLTCNQHLRYELHNAKRTILALKSKLSLVQTEERCKLSHDLHDCTGQNLSAISMNLGLIEAAFPAADLKALAAVAECKQLLQACIRDIRTISYTLHPPLLEELGLVAALRCFIEGFTRRSSIEVELRVTSKFGRLGTMIEATLFRIAQEALSNVYRHSGSKTATVSLHQYDHEITMIVADQGRGMAVTKNGNAGVGLSSIRRQASLIHAALEMVPGPGHTLKLTVPTTDISNL